MSVDTAGHLLDLAERLAAIETDAAGCGVDVHVWVHDAIVALGREAGARAVRELAWSEVMDQWSAAGGPPAST